MIICCAIVGIDSQICNIIPSPSPFYLTPLIPLSFKGEREVWVERGFAPLRLSLFILVLLLLLIYPSLLR